MTAAPGKIKLRSNDLFFKQTFGRNPEAVCLANNHIMDFGKQGFTDTLEILKYNDIKFFGAGDWKNNYHNPLILCIDNQRIALMGYVCPSTNPIFARDNYPGVVPIDLDKISEDIKLAKSNNVNYIVVQLHWGEEEVFLPRPKDIFDSHAIIDLGADLIIGHHAHCIQPYEIYKGKYIFYGLGNCIFPDDSDVYYFNEEDGYSRQTIDNWFWWNRFSFAVQLDIVLKNTNFIGLEYNQVKCWQVNGLRKEKYRLVISKNYNELFEKNIKFSVLRRIFFGLFKRLKFPTLKRIRSVLNILKKKSDTQNVDN